MVRILALTLANHKSVFNVLLLFKPDLGLQLSNDKNVISRVAKMFDDETIYWIMNNCNLLI